MMLRRRHISGSAFALGISLVCTALVCSVIVFEVLDVDGSARPSRSTQAMTVPVPEALHDIKHASLRGAAPLWADPAALGGDGSGELEGPPRSALLHRVPPACPRARGIRAPSPRASPLGPPPSA
ncbi:MAG TPA: hypothetical protein VIG69_06245 [Candidatus Methylomirabilis sp.]|jgi:hypothetical protein